jgi:hypothetical protein
MTGDQFLKLRQSCEEARDILEREVGRARAKVRHPARRKMRPATANDVQEGRIFWYFHDDKPHFWCIIEEVRYPGDDFKAFLADDGCRYGLKGAYVEKDR